MRRREEENQWFVTAATQFSADGDERCAVTYTPPPPSRASLSYSRHCFFARFKAVSPQVRIRETYVCVYRLLKRGPVVGGWEFKRLFVLFKWWWWFYMFFKLTLDEIYSKTRLLLLLFLRVCTVQSKLNFPALGSQSWPTDWLTDHFGGGENGIDFESSISRRSSAHTNIIKQQQFSSSSSSSYR